MLATETPKILSLNDPAKKMSKSLGPKSYVGLFEDEATVRSKVRSAITDPGDPAQPMGEGAQNLHWRIARVWQAGCSRRI